MPAPPISPRPPSRRPCRRPTTSRASPPKTRSAACPTKPTSPREQPDLDLFHPWDVDQRAGRRAGARMRGRGAVDRQAHHQQRRRGRLGAAKPLLQRPHARLSRRLCQLAPLDLGGADRRQGRRHAARRLVQLDALGRRAGRARRPSGRYAAERALSRLKSRKIKTTRVPGAVRVAAGGRPAGRPGAGHQRRRAVPQEHLPARFAGQAGAARSTSTSPKTRTSCAARAARPSTTKA